MKENRIQPAADRPAPRPQAEADEAAARDLVARRELGHHARESLTRASRRAALAMIRRRSI